MNEQQTREQIEQLQAERQQILEQPAGYPGRTEVLAMIGTDLRKAERRLAAFELERNTCTTHGRVRCDECQPERIAPGQLEPLTAADVIEQTTPDVFDRAQMPEGGRWSATDGRWYWRKPAGKPAGKAPAGLAEHQGELRDEAARVRRLADELERQADELQPAAELQPAGPAERQGELADEAAQLLRHLVAAGAVWLLRQVSAEAERMADELERPRASRR